MPPVYCAVKAHTPMSAFDKISSNHSWTNATSIIAIKNAHELATHTTITHSSSKCIFSVCLPLLNLHCFVLVRSITWPSSMSCTAQWNRTASRGRASRWSRNSVHCSCCIVLPSVGSQASRTARSRGCKASRSKSAAIP